MSKMPQEDNKGLQDNYFSARLEPWLDTRRGSDLLRLRPMCAFSLA